MCESEREQGKNNTKRESGLEPSELIKDEPERAKKLIL